MHTHIHIVYICTDDVGGARQCHFMFAGIPLCLRRPRALGNAAAGPARRRTRRLHSNDQVSQRAWPHSLLVGCMCVCALSLSFLFVFLMFLSVLYVFFLFLFVCLMFPLML